MRQVSTRGMTTRQLEKQLANTPKYIVERLALKRRQLGLPELDAQGIPLKDLKGEAASKAEIRRRLAVASLVKRGLSGEAAELVVDKRFN